MATTDSALTKRASVAKRSSVVTFEQAGGRRPSMAAVRRQSLHRQSSASRRQSTTIGTTRAEEDNMAIRAYLGEHASGRSLNDEVRTAHARTVAL